MSDNSSSDESTVEPVTIAVAVQPNQVNTSENEQLVDCPIIQVSPSVSQPNVTEPSSIPAAVHTSSSLQSIPERSSVLSGPARISSLLNVPERSSVPAGIHTSSSFSNVPVQPSVSGRIRSGSLPNIDQSSGSISIPGRFPSNTSLTSMTDRSTGATGYPTSGSSPSIPERSIHTSSSFLSDRSTDTTGYPTSGSLLSIPEASSIHTSRSFLSEQSTDTTGFTTSGSLLSIPEASSIHTSSSFLSEQSTDTTGFTTSSSIGDLSDRDMDFNQPTNPPSTPVEPLPIVVIQDSPSTDSSSRPLHYAASCSTSYTDLSPNTGFASTVSMFDSQSSNPVLSTESMFDSQSSNPVLSTESLPNTSDGIERLSLDSSEDSTTGSKSFGSSSYFAGSSSEYSSDKSPTQLGKDPKTTRQDMKKSQSQSRMPENRRSPSRLSLSPEGRRSSDPLGAVKSPSRSKSPGSTVAEKHESIQTSLSDPFRRQFPPGFSYSTESGSIGRQATLDDVSEISMDSSMSDLSDRRSQTRSPTPSDGGSSTGRGRRRSSLVDDLHIIYEASEEHRNPEIATDSHINDQQPPEHRRDSDKVIAEEGEVRNEYLRPKIASTSTAKHLEPSTSSYPSIENQQQAPPNERLGSSPVPEIEIEEANVHEPSQQESCSGSHSPSPVLSEVSEKVGNGSSISISESSCGDSAYAKLQQWMDVGARSPTRIATSQIDESVPETSQLDDSVHEISQTEEHVPEMDQLDQPVPEMEHLDEPVPGTSGYQGLLARERTPESDTSPLSDFQPSDSSELGTDYLQTVLAKSEAAKSDQPQDQPPLMASNLPSFLLPYFQEIAGARNVMDPRELNLLVFGRMVRSLEDSEGTGSQRNINLRVARERNGNTRVAFSRVKSVP